MPIQNKPGNLSYAPRTFIHFIFPLVETPLKLFFSHNININHFLKPYLWDEFSIYETRKRLMELGLVNIKNATLAEFYISTRHFL